MVEQKRVQFADDCHENVNVQFIGQFTKLYTGFLYFRVEITNAMPLIYHVTTNSLWSEAEQLGFYEAPSLKAEGFIHCSEAHQVQGVLERYYKGQNNLVKLVIDTEQLSADLIYEWSPSTQDTFPHIYGTIKREAVTEVQKITV